MEIERGFGGWWRTSTALDFIIISYYSVSTCTQLQSVALYYLKNSQRAETNARRLPISPHDNSLL